MQMNSKRCSNLKSKDSHVANAWDVIHIGQEKNTNSGDIMCFENPFNKSKSEIPLMKILVDTSSLEDEIVSNANIIVKLIRMSNFPYIDFYFISCDNKDVNKKLKKEEIELIQVEDIPYVLG